MKIVITEKQVVIEGKGNLKLLLALLTKAIESVMIALMQHHNLTIMQAGFMAYKCVNNASDKLLDMTEDKENE